MKTKYLFFTLLLLVSCREAPSPWQMAPSPLKTRWAADVTPENAWQEYPRPQMVRHEWQNLNGLWDFAITPKDSIPAQFSQKILVPFPVESALSGIGQKVGTGNQVWYKREFRISPYWKGRRILLHFEASDWETKAWLNGHPVGEHRGGYDPFTFDITEHVRPGVKNEILVAVGDPTNDGYQPRGKQVNDPKGIFYTSTTGIWQTVWIEPVSDPYFTELQIVTDIDSSRIRILPDITGSLPSDIIHLDIGDSVRVSGNPGKWIEVSIKDARLWQPDDPFLYTIGLQVSREDRIMDEIITYAGLRKVTLGKDEQGFTRIFLNHEPLFQNGPLDQGFWPDGIYTPPTEEAMKYDLQMTRAMGFNMLRKHVKVENRRFYYWCDQLGMLVWQDMPSSRGYVPPGDSDLIRPEAERTQFELELTRMIMHLINHPSIIMWVPFNEGWGQYETDRVVELIQSLDSTRLVNNASGWQDRGVGDIFDIHHYPEPRMPALEENRASVLGEFGGLGFYVEDHSWQKENWGYQQITDRDSLRIRFAEFYDSVKVFKERGMSAAVYTQTTDVETECNGLMTYDRAVVKMDTAVVKGIMRFR
ncbi:MAG: glycoside hydrolase family 2 TIM barrel-domain containing protein [Bacteroidales bacterium]|nr:glycoside hydrolase family 2 TIM barrel-domain containing protein [Bacteroidales bacterium]